jgi:hypothetical protein
MIGVSSRTSGGPVKSSPLLAIVSSHLDIVCRMVHTQCPAVHQTNVLSTREDQLPFNQIGRTLELACRMQLDLLL